MFALVDAAPLDRPLAVAVAIARADAKVAPMGLPNHDCDQAQDDGDAPDDAERQARQRSLDIGIDDIGVIARLARLHHRHAVGETAFAIRIGSR